MALKFVNQTSRHLFLTGKAGTGKTTFLRYIKETSHKKLAVIAPTGVAAMNAGGVTIHSFFQLPIGNFLPGENMEDGNFYNRSSLLKQLRINGNKRKLIQELDLLVIDEVSMVRADLLDAVDLVLQHVRRQHTPFGGVQMLFIGDLFQLPPVVSNDTWGVLKNHYKDPFFFHSHVLQQDPPLYIELKKIYRQKDEIFIDLLNNLRNNCLEKKDIEFLNQYYRHDFKPAVEGEYITLTTHNYRADQINISALEKLPGKLFSFDATVEGDFQEKTVRAEKRLQLKTGAQIMFIRNDKGESSRYFNGKIGTIRRIEEEEIYVTFPDEKLELLVEKETWENVYYKYISETDQIEEEVLGTFTQFPICLAWAITIHKSQGLTFSKAIIDAGNAFAPGQVYVALSRLSSLEGLVLQTPITSAAVSTNAEAIAFSATEPSSEIISIQLKQEQERYIHNMLLRVFNWTSLVESLDAFLMELDHKRLPNERVSKLLFADLVKKATEQRVTADKFAKQLEKLLSEISHNGYEPVYKRVEAAGKYFTDLLFKDLFSPLQEHYDKTKGRNKVKKYLKDLEALSNIFKQKKNQLEQIITIVAGLIQGTDATILLQQIVEGKKLIKQSIVSFDSVEQPAKEKFSKGASPKISLQMFKENKSIRQIAEARSFAEGTIESHLISFIATGELGLKELVSEAKINAIQNVIDELGDVPSSQYKEKLGEAYSYREIKAVINHNKRIKKV